MAKLTKTKPRANSRPAANKSLRTKAARGSKQPEISRNNPPGTKSSSRSAAPADLRTQVRQILKGLAKAYPDATCALKHESAYELLVATILSAQCTDERVNMVTPVLFAKYPDIESLATATQSDLEEIIRSTGFFRAKANSLRGMAQGVMERFGGQNPQIVGRSGDAARRRTQNGQRCVGNRVGNSQRRGGRHARQADHVPVGAHQKHVSRTNRARIDGNHPPKRMGQFLAPVDSSRTADLHCAAAQMPGMSIVRLLPPSRASAAQVSRETSFRRHIAE